MVPEDRKLIGRAEKVTFPEINIADVYARIDTGARISALWTSKAVVTGDVLEVVLFDKQSQFFNGQVLRFHEFDSVVVTSSNGQSQERYKVQLLVKLKGKKIRAWFTLADRSTQVYPVLIGRNVLAGKFVVDVKRGSVLHDEELARSHKLQAEQKTNSPEEV